MALFGELRGRSLSMAVWGVAMWAILIFGYNQASAGGVLGMPSFLKQFPQLDTTGTHSEAKSAIQGTIVALYTAAGVFGALSTTFLGDIFGRRRVIFAAAFVSLLGAILMSTSFSLAQFCVARLVLGLGTGGIIATVSVWQSELSRPQSRGSHVSGFGIFCGSGLSLALWIDFGMSHASGSVAWRFSLAFYGFFSIIVMCTIFLVPESPRWLIKKARVDEARHILSRMHDTDIDDDIIKREVHDVQATIELSGSSNLSALLTMGPRRIFHRVVIAISAQMFLQLSGINAVAYYAPSIFENQLHYPAEEAGILAAASQICLALGSIVCSFSVDRFGRRNLMMVSAALMAVCFACLAGLTSDPENKPALKAAVFFVFFFYFVYTLGFLGIPFLYASEVAPVHLRAAVCGISTAASWLFNFLVVEITPVAFNNLGWKYFLVYACINTICVPIVYFFYPETAGRSLEEIDQVFVASNSVFDPVKVARRAPKGEMRQDLDEQIEKQHNVGRDKDVEAMAERKISYTEQIGEN